MIKRILCLWFPSWPLQRLVIDRPMLRGQAVVLYANQPRQGQRVVGCSAAAYEMGIRTGMSLAEASSLPGTGSFFGTKDALSAPESMPKYVPVPLSPLPGTALPGTGSFFGTKDAPSAPESMPKYVPVPLSSQLHFEQHDPAADFAQLERLAAASQRYSPVVGLDQDQPASCLFMEISGSAPRLGGEVRLIQTLAEDLHHQGYVPRIAVADTVGAAWAVSHYGELEPLYECEIGFQPVMDRPTGRKPFPRKPRKVIGKAFCLPPRHGLEWLAELPIESLRLDSRSLDTLHALGILRVGQLLQLPRDGLAARFDPQLLSRLDQATGKTSESIVVLQKPLPLQASYCFEHSTQHLVAIKEVIRELLDQLTERLAQRGLGALQLECRFSLATTTVSESMIRVGLYQPTAVTEHLLELVQMQLQNYHFRAAVKQITVHVTCSATILRQQPGLLPDSCQAISAQLRNLIERISSRLSAEAIVAPKLYAEPLPEHAYRYVALTSSGSGNKLQWRRKSRTASQTARQVHAAGLRPLRLYDPTRQIQVATEGTRGLPTAFHYEGKPHRVVHAWGPERIETGWWRAPLVRRDYFRVEDQTGGRFWIFRDLNNQRWFLHGIFS